MPAPSTVRAVQTSSLKRNVARHAVPVTLAVILRTENTRAGHRAENGEVKHKDQLVDDGNAGHLLRADAARP